MIRKIVRGEDNLFKKRARPVKPRQKGKYYYQGDYYVKRKINESVGEFAKQCTVRAKRKVCFY
jgi:hypothetical protein